jgi:type IV secretion system protein VirB6
MRLDLVFAAVVTAFGNVIFLCIALFVVTLAKLFLTFVIAVGPLFVLCLAWRPTATVLRQLAVDGSQRRGADLVRVLRAGPEHLHGDKPWFRSSSQGGFLGPTFNVVGESLKYCVVMILMAIICFQAPSLASALTGGAAVQQGIQMIQNAMMVSGLRSASAARGAGAGGAAGGVVRAGAGLPYAAGQATGAAAPPQAVPQAPWPPAPAPWFDRDTAR